MVHLLKNVNDTTQTSEVAEGEDPEMAEVNSYSILNHYKILYNKETRSSLDITINNLIPNT